jgi:all-trans-retinol dehydrogenase (NAD+)
MNRRLNLSESRVLITGGASGLGRQLAIHASQRGSAIVIWDRDKVGVAKQTDYSASKFAAVGFMESLRAELRAVGSSVNALTVCPFYINTGMFDGVQTRFPALLPILDQDVVAREILDAVSRGRATLVLPWFARTLPLVRMLPIRAFDRVADFFGINKTMDNFRGR